MPLVPMDALLADALAGGYAVCYCESWNLESFQAVIEAASELNSPVIAGFSGGFLADPGRRAPENLAYYAGMARALKSAPIPVSLLLNETGSFSQIEAAIELGFNAIMVENERLSFEEYSALVRQVVALAHRRGVHVEAQLGHLANGWDQGEGHGEFTDPEVARAFVKDTGIDALAVAIGNVHILTSGTATVNLEALDRIREAVSLPLVLHGGTGFPPDAVDAVILRGVAKFNFGTGLKQAFLAAVRERLEAYREPMNPHPFVGMGGSEDVLTGGREAMTRQVMELLRRFRSAGKAGRLSLGSVNV
ncbi:MAG: class II fructose-bisphosphate aldolase [Acidobacteria bacterium]|nr:class II fructose-bisphosphate aldolase [Acidobacteriota bacterium]